MRLNISRLFPIQTKRNTTGNVLLLVAVLHSFYCCIIDTLNEFCRSGKTTRIAVVEESPSDRYALSLFLQ